jgi:hypothetical protein
MVPVWAVGMAILLCAIYVLVLTALLGPQSDTCIQNPSMTSISNLLYELGRPYLLHRQDVRLSRIQCPGPRVPFLGQTIRTMHPAPRPRYDRPTLIIAGIGRDLEPTKDRLWTETIDPIITTHATQVERPVIAIILYENGSKDATCAIWKRNAARLVSKFARTTPPCRVVPHLMLRQTNEEPDRTTRLAHARNAVLDVICGLAPTLEPTEQEPATEHVRDKDWEPLVLWMDMDEVNASGGALASGWATVSTYMQATVRHTLGLFPVQPEGSYYDMWALRHPTLMPFDCWECTKRADLLHKSDSDRTVECIGRYAGELHQLIRTKQEQTKRATTTDTNDALIDVDSAFGGAGLYVLSDLIAAQPLARYNGQDKNKLTGVQTARCEHVEFHRQLKHVFPDKRLFIDTQWQTDRR